MSPPYTSPVHCTGSERWCPGSILPPYLPSSILSTRDCKARTSALVSSWKVMEGLGKSWKVMEGSGRSCKVLSYIYTHTNHPDLIRRDRTKKIRKKLNLDMLSCCVLSNLNQFAVHLLNIVMSVCNRKKCWCIKEIRRDKIWMCWWCCVVEDILLPLSTNMLEKCLLTILLVSKCQCQQVVTVSGGDVRGSVLVSHQDHPFWAFQGLLN